MPTQTERDVLGGPSFLRRVLSTTRSIACSLERLGPRFRRTDEAEQPKPFPQEAQDLGLLVIHVPKAAGTSLHLALYGRRLGHASLAEWERDYPQAMLGIRTAAVVRDPVDRFLSAYYYLKQGGNNAFDLEFSEKFLRPYDTAGSLADVIDRLFVRRWLLRKGFHFRRQVDFLRDRNGRMSIDHFFAYERLDIAADRLTSLLGRPIRLPHLNQTPRADAGLTQRQRERILATYAEDAALHRLALATTLRHDPNSTRAG